MKNKLDIKRIDTNTLIIYDTEAINIFSYNSHIARFTREKMIFFKDWNYSSTTSRGRNKAMNYLGFEHLNTTDKILNDPSVIIED